MGCHCLLLRKPELIQTARRRQSGLAPTVGWHLEVLTLIQELPPLPLEPFTLSLDYLDYEDLFSVVLLCILATSF